MQQVLDKIRLARKVVGDKMPDWDIHYWTFDYGLNSHEYFVEPKWAVWYSRSWEGPGPYVSLDDVKVETVAQQIAFMIEAANSW